MLDAFDGVRRRIDDMEVFYTSRVALARGDPPEAGTPSAADLAATLDRLGVREEMPFLISRDGVYDQRLNEFLRNLPYANCPSPRTWKAYANDIAGFQRFLDADGGGHVLDIGYERLVAYHRRRLLDRNPVAASTWNRCLAALEKLFDWAAACGHVDGSPFPYQTARGGLHRFGPTRINPLHATDVPGEDDDGEPIRCVSIGDWRLFRDVGLDGRLGVGDVEDESFRGRNRQRNLAIADLLLNTGMRVTEGVSLLEAELPSAGATAAKGLHSMRLAPYVAKRRKGRRILVSNRTLVEKVVPYVEEKRRQAIAKGLLGAYRVLEHPLLLAHLGRDGCRTVDGEELPYARLDPRTRRSMFLVDRDGAVAEPAMLFLGMDGMPTTADNVRAFFARAMGRCPPLEGRGIKITPHTLRHTYAVNMLTQLMRVTIERHQFGKLIDIRSMDPARELFREITLNPVDHVRRLLGHRSVETTYKYLTYVRDADDALHASFSQWDSQLGKPPPPPGDDGGDP